MKTASAALARCKICKDLMVLLLQLNGELPNQFPGHERRLYVFSCRRKTCRRKEGSIRALRGVKATATAMEEPVSAVKETVVAEKETAKEEPPKPLAGLGESLFGVKGLGSGSGGANPFATGAKNPFSSGAPSGNAANPFAPKPTQPAPNDTEAKKSTEEEVKTLPKTFAETLSLNNDPQQAAGLPPPPPSEPWPAEDAQPAPYPVSWIADAEYETLDPIVLPKVPTTTMDLDDGGGPSSSSASGGGGGKEDKVVFESSMDATFQKFADRIGQNPEQVLRYEYGGAPLLYSKDDAVGKALSHSSSSSSSLARSGMPRCANCGAGRVFEAQLMPHAIAELEADEEGLEGMDWGTVIVATCERDCPERGAGEGEASYVEEWAGVQWEELSSKR